jgi:hypothetical protein
MKGYTNNKLIQTVRKEILCGLVGTSFASQYINWSLDIHPNDVINNGMDETNLKKIEKLERVQLLSIIWGIVSLAVNKGSDEDKVKNVLSFIKWLAKNKKDLAVAMSMAIINDELNPQIKGMAIINKSMRKLLNNTAGKWWYNAITSDKNLNDSLGKIAWGNNE